MIKCNKFNVTIDGTPTSTTADLYCIIKSFRNALIESETLSSEKTEILINSIVKAALKDGEEEIDQKIDPDVMKHARFKWELNSIYGVPRHGEKEKN